MQTKPRHPLVVVDWNVIQTVGRRGLNFPPDWDLLLADEVTHEALNKSDSERGHRRNLVDMYRRHQDRIWVAKPAHCFTLYCRCISIAQIVAVKASTMAIRDLLESEFRVARASPQHQAFLAEQVSFRLFMSQYRDGFQQKVPRDRAIVSDEDKCIALAREPIHDALKPEVKARFGLTDAMMNRYPDALPFCRWLRLCKWYALRHAGKPAGRKAELESENDYCDATYAFLSSYTGNLLTNDVGCQRAARVLRPDVRVRSLSECGVS